MMIMMAALWGLAIWGGYTLIKKYVLAKHQPIANMQQTPLEILQERYAKGEITSEEYDRMKKDITG